MFFWRNKVPKSDASVLFIFIAAVGTLILAAAVLRIGSVKKIVVEEHPAISVAEVTDALPRDVVGSVKELKVGSVADSTTVVAYRQSGQQVIGLVQRDRSSGKYVLRHRTALRSELNHVELPDMSVEQYGWGNQPMIELRWPLANGGAEDVSFVRLDGVRLRQVLVEGADGVSRCEHFISGGQDELGQSELNIEDYDSDGIFELVVTVTGEDGDVSVDVFLWGDDKLSWSEHWSRALEVVRKGLFPEPAE